MTAAGCHDVAVLGAGVAGCATALALLRQGLRVLLLDRRRAPPDQRFGETLSPSAGPTLRRLGLWPAFLAQGHLRSPVHRAHWNGERRELDLLAHPAGEAWHLDRARFDRLLLRAAVEAGADCCWGLRPRAPLRTATGWRLEAEGDGGCRAFHAAFLVDATGRAAWLGRRLGGRRRRFDRLIALAALRSPKAAAPGEAATLVEAVSEGWWYSAVVPDGRLSLAFFTDGDLPAARPGVEGLSAAPVTRARLASYHRGGGPQRLSCGSQRLAPACGDRWLAVGDAAVAFDPLSSHGLSTALTSALQAGDTVVRDLGGDATARPGYAAQVDWRVDSFCRLQRQVYAEERRWPGSPFWQRRAAA